MKDGEKLSKWQQGLFRYCGLQTKCKSTVPCHMQEELTPCYKQGGYSLQNLWNHSFILLSTDKGLGLNAVPRLGNHSSTTMWPSWSSFRLNWCRLVRHLQDHNFWGWGERWVVYAKKKRGRRKKKYYYSLQIFGHDAQRERSNLSSVLGWNTKALKLQVSKAFP